MSILEPTTCGFGILAIYNVLTEVRLTKESNESFKDLRSREVNKQLELLVHQFSGNEKITLTGNLLQIIYVRLLKTCVC